MSEERVHFEIRTQLESLRAELMTRHLIERRVCKVHAEVGWRSRPELIPEMSVMQSCSSALWVLILLTTTFTIGSESVNGPVKVKLHDSATLPCSERCSGLARWTLFSKRSDTLAECDQTSCRSVKEGYQMIHDQYLKGNLSLTITDADFSKRGWYTSDCASKDVCDVHLQIEPLNTTVEMMASESLILRVDVSDPVDVIYNSAGTPGPSSGQICTVDGPSLQCKPEYTRRSSLTSGVELRRMAPSDSGVYTVMDSRNKEVIHTYTVTVQGSESVNGPVKVKLHDSATLFCFERCSGLARWTVFHKRSDTLAECDQTSCRSVKEGYQMIHDQYLKGNLSLIITDADFSKRGWYTSDCASKDVCDVHLQIEQQETIPQVSDKLKMWKVVLPWPELARQNSED
ncbi:hypothetical protein SRHO_G00257200 [Serrasalmus rhombeus]